MTCEEAEMLLHALIDGELTPAMRVRSKTMSPAARVARRRFAITAR